MIPAAIASILAHKKISSASVITHITDEAAWEIGNHQFIIDLPPEQRAEIFHAFVIVQLLKLKD